MNEHTNTYDLTNQFVRVQWLFSRYRHMAHEGGARRDPHRGQGRILKLLKLHPEISQKDLLYLLDMRPQSLGELLSKLEKNGCITRTPSDEDKRAMIVKLTEEGEKAASMDDAPDFSTLFSCLGDEEQEVLGGYLDRIIAGLEERIGSEQEEPYPEHQGHGHRRSVPDDMRFERPDPRDPRNFAPRCFDSCYPDPGHVRDDPFHHHHGHAHHGHGHHDRPDCRDDNGRPDSNEPCQPK